VPVAEYSAVRGNGPMCQPERRLNASERAGLVHIREKISPVTTGLGGDDLVVLEGHVRLTAFMLARDRLPPELQVLVGASPTIARWDCW
jgi:hypothetical protein